MPILIKHLDPKGPEGNKCPGFYSRIYGKWNKEKCITVKDPSTLVLGIISGHFRQSYFEKMLLHFWSRWFWLHLSLDSRKLVSFCVSLSKTILVTPPYCICSSCPFRLPCNLILSTDLENLCLTGIIHLSLNFCFHQSTAFYWKKNRRFNHFFTVVKLHNCFT